MKIQRFNEVLSDNIVKLQIDNIKSVSNFLIDIKDVVIYCYKQDYDNGPSYILKELDDYDIYLNSVSINDGDLKFTLFLENHYSNTLVKEFYIDVNRLEDAIIELEIKKYNI